MILINTYAPGGVVAQLYVDDEPSFDVTREDEHNLKGWQPSPPYTHFGPGGERVIKREFLGAAGSWMTSISAAVSSLHSKRMISGAKKRLARAERKVAYERSRLAALQSVHRIFDARTGEEILLDKDGNQ